MDESEINRFSVHPSFHGEGVGSAIIDALEAEAAVRGLRSVTLEASPSLKGFYERRGCVKQRNDRLLVGNATFDFTLMRRTLGQ